jgi:hypothetical protein
MKIHFSAFGYSFDLFSLATCTYAMQPNYLRCETSGFLHVNFSSGVMPWTVAVGVRFMIYTTIVTALAQK